MTSPENRLTVGTITATDADGNPLTYAIAGGADAARFTINAQTGVLRFVTAPNFEAPADADANNVYDLTVSVSDGIAPAVTQAITVTVTDADRERHRLERLRRRPTRRRRPRPTTRPTTSSA